MVVVVVVVVVMMTRARKRMGWAMPVPPIVVHWCYRYSN